VSTAQAAKGLLALCLARERRDADLTALLTRAIPGTPTCPPHALD